MKKAVNLSIAKTRATIPSQFTASETTWIAICSAASTWTSKACIAFEIRPLILVLTFRFRYQILGTVVWNYGKLLFSAWWTL